MPKALSCRACNAPWVIPSWAAMIDRFRLRDICVEAGQIARRMWPGDGHRVKSWGKSDDSPVSAADLAVDSFLKTELGRLLPSAGWLSEETADDPSRLERALVSSGRPLLGLLVAPARGEVWTATAGAGARLNGVDIAASKRRVFPGARVPADSLPREDQDLTTVDKPNSIALRIAMVADDRADLIATLRWGYEWDVAAAALIAREAGAQVTDAFGQPLAYNKRDPRAFGLLVSAPAIHQAAVERLAPRAEKLA